MTTITLSTDSLLISACKHRRKCTLKMGKKQIVIPEFYNISLRWRFIAIDRHDISISRTSLFRVCSLFPLPFCIFKNKEDFLLSNMIRCFVNIVFVFNSFYRWCPCVWQFDLDYLETVCISQIVILCQNTPDSPPINLNVTTGVLLIMHYPIMQYVQCNV